MYHYAECGLNNVYLVNGYIEEETEYGPATAIMNLQGLHNAIGKRIVMGTARLLLGEEIRFLRKELNLSQKNLGAILGVKDQTVARWEKDERVIPKSADMCLRALFMETKFGSCNLAEVIDKLNNIDARYAMVRLEMKECENEEWVADSMAA